MLALAHTFPSHQQLRIWDTEAVDHRATHGASHGEKVTAQFLLSVWNQWHAYDAGAFDLFEAVRVWDEEHLKAFQAWASDPVCF
ncbi:hypothetical protein PSMK_p00570 (plasmid) [Phycisphaera mikurensis NBRC 102666]|uniref:Uncharacterized protein n=2 Tax=Phycisphaera TaxID=666508 RepID=I0IJI1_PHYMF|nr:hypothetical protein PSMK_p00570 [Phycisphaera mikurensis NBRC 102666]